MIVGFIFLGMLAIAAVVAGVVFILQEDLSGIIFVCLGIGLGLVCWSAATVKFCTDWKCNYAYATSDRINAACKQHAGVREFEDAKYVCNDGLAGYLKVGFYKKGTPPPSP